MENHPIEGLMLTAMNSIENMIDVNTIIGEPIETSNDIVIIPVSKVTFGFAAGGSEFKGETVDEHCKKDKDEKLQCRLPFGGGSGAGVSINPIAFLIAENDKVRLLPISHSSCIDKLLDYVPDLFEKIAKTKENINCMQEKCEAENVNNNSKENDISKQKEPQRYKAHINKAPKTTEKNLSYNSRKNQEKVNEEIADGLEDLFEEEFEYDDD